MIRELLQDAESRMRGAVGALEADLHSFRTGRASPHLLDRLEVELYGVQMPLNQVASISVPEPQQLAIRPYDQNALSAIEKAILKSDLGIMPNNDGKIIRLNLPRLTEERRRDLSRQVGRRVEEAKVAVRNVRRDTLNDLREMKEEKMISEDQFFTAQDDLQELTNKYTDKIDELGRQKEAEIMEV
ncbi:MAG: ribosome recycling factor [Chloroflexi bacterium]|nr:ribosome recycling factor [Chloroflexota bacterium]MCI0644271.1 ribosome recycling factor [Chloroflexota bacterium]MCI0726254.1 ribosome recycling factor [Chloroflexota bacterium]